MSKDIQEIARAISKEAAECDDDMVTLCSQRADSLTIYNGDVLDWIAELESDYGDAVEDCGAAYACSEWRDAAREYAYQLVEAALLQAVADLSE